MTLPDEAEFWQAVQRTSGHGYRPKRAVWHDVPAGEPRPKLAKYQSPHHVFTKSACGETISLYALGGVRGKPVNCRRCMVARAQSTLNTSDKKETS